MKTNKNTTQIDLTKKEAEYLDLIRSKMVTAYNEKMSLMDYILRKFPAREGWVLMVVWNSDKSQSYCYFTNKRRFDDLYFGFGFKNIFTRLGYSVIEKKLTDCFCKNYAKRGLNRFEIIRLVKR